MIPLIDLKQQYQAIKGELRPAIDAVLEKAQWILGPEVRAFEEEFAAYCGTRYAVGVNSGTSALHLALLAAGAGPGDEVVTVPLTFTATVAAIRYTGATPVFVDVDPESLTIDAGQIEKAITARTKAIVPVHLYGQMADMEPLLSIAHDRGLAVIEDAAQAHGAEYKGRRAGSLGHFGCFSFYPSKNLGACGEAGAITTNDPEGVRVLRMLRDWGQEKKNRHVLKGYNYRLEGIQGAILRVKLRHLEEWIEARRRHARHYANGLAGTALALAGERPDTRHVYHLYVVRLNERARLQKHLGDAGVETGIHYPVCVHLQEAHSDLGYRPGAFPVAEAAADSVLSLPMYPELTAEQVDTVIHAAGRFAGQAAVQRSGVQEQSA